MWEGRSLRTGGMTQKTVSELRVCICLQLYLFDQELDVPDVPPAIGLQDQAKAQTHRWHMKF